MAYDRAILMPAMEAIYELDSRRYLLQGIDQGQAESIETVQPADYFTPAGARAAAR